MKEAMNLKENMEWNMGGFGGKDEMGKLCNLL